ncbi:hypothetical protein GYMLUDRAFT_64343 [Collybiopsis luxurians FD-317 M1]|uniref:Uncharacterized protein n=1 Tax=Collybiopsis luxurians FD-317 M1 TaxID=944289 RepID=A0A0D0BRF6_9AGAR|nr:hypothetical protein GYMLUDRAFT_64343 [Collybiopsis luxurians FD-317 M1]
MDTSDSLEPEALNDFSNQLMRTMINNLGPGERPTLINQSGMNALFTVQELIRDLKECIQIMEEIGSQPEANIPALLTSVERRVEADIKDAQCITQREAYDKLQEFNSLAVEAGESMAQLQLRYPDTSPIRIDNGRLV